MENKKSISTFSMTLMCIGSIIGGGIFGSLTSATAYVGPLICIAFIIASLTVFSYTIPSVVPSSTIPSAAGYYTALNRLVSPYLGVLEFANLITLCVLDVALASTFTSYFVQLVPANEVLVNCIVLIVFTVIAYCGIQFGSMVQNVMTIILVITMTVFIALGMKHIDPNNFTIAKAFDFNTEGGSRTAFFAAVALLTNCLGGGNAGVHMANSMKDPRRGVMVSFIASTAIVCVIYMFLGAVVAGIDPNASDLGAIAKTFMGNGLFTWFIIGGALMAVVTTINCVTLAGGFRFEALTRDKVLPEVFGKKNRFGQNGLGLIILCICGLGIILLNLPLGTLFAVVSFISVVMNVVNIIPVLLVEKRYPHAYKHSPLKLKKVWLYIFIAFATVFCLYEAYATVVETSGPVWIALLVTLGIFYGYFFIRKAYLKKQGIDLIATMKAPIPEWEENEAKWAAVDAEEAESTKA